jgi:UDP-glucose 6-dehydrogenase
MKIGVIGVGKLGLSFSLLSERKGIEVICSDFNKSYVDSLSNKTLKTDEPLIEEYLLSSKNIQFNTDNSEIIRKTDLICCNPLTT